MRRPLLALLAGSALMFSACGDGREDGGTAPPAPDDVIEDGATTADAPTNTTPDASDGTGPPRVCEPDTLACVDGVPRRCVEGRTWAFEAPCAANARCVAGACVCVPRCDGRACGDDGCGGQCGACAPWQTCDTARCALREGACEPGTTRECYTGATGTARVGRCRAGRQTCGADGVWATACEGQVLPSAVETCGDGVDEDCDGSVDEGCAAMSCAVSGNLGSALGEAIVRGGTEGAPDAMRGSCGGNGSPERAYLWTAPAAGAYTFATRGARYDTLLYLRDGGCDGRELACNDDIIASESIASQVTVTLAAGQTVLVVVDGYGTNAAGTFVLQITAGTPERCTAGARSDCYAGPEGTAGVGRCRAGSLTCHASGAWTDVCLGEVGPVAEVCSNNLDDDCDGSVDEGCPTVATRALRGRLSYQYRRANAARSDWGPLEDKPARGFAVYAMRGDVRVSAAVTGADGDEAGRFTLRVPDPPAPEDRIVVAALAEDGRGAIAYAVAEPGGSGGTRTPFTTPAPAPRVWSWSWRVQSVPAGGELRIDESVGSGVAHVFDATARSVETAARAYPGAARRSVLVWMQYGVSWSCGACFTPNGTDAFGQGFASQVAFPGGADATWWSDSVVAHELGHWTMESYGVSPREGGPHYLNTASAPGLAWSEGYATWMGAVAREDPLYLTKQQGTMFWFDLAARQLGSTSGTSGAWLRGNPSGGLLQSIHENEVSAMLWALAPSGSRAPLHAALASPRMTVGPFARGYFSAITGASVPVLPDFFDALVCGGFARERVAEVVRGTYPYDPAGALCSGGAQQDVDAPVVASWRVVAGPTSDTSGGASVRLIARVEQRGWLPVPVRASVRLPAGVTLRQGPRKWAVASTGPGTAHETAFEVAYGAVPSDDLALVVDTQDASMGVHAEALWRFGRPEPTTAAPPATGPRMTLNGHDLGPSVSVDLSARE